MVNNMKQLVNGIVLFICTCRAESTLALVLRVLVGVVHAAPTVNVRHIV
jgi:hypothetical protein